MLMVDLAGVEPASRMPYFKACTTILLLLLVTCFTSCTFGSSFDRFYATLCHFDFLLTTRLAIAFTVFGLGGFLPFKICETLRGLGIVLSFVQLVLYILSSKIAMHFG